MTQAWWEGVNAEYGLEPHHVKLLTLAAENWDRATLAREGIAEHGLTYTDRFGSPRKRPDIGSGIRNDCICPAYEGARFRLRLASNLAERFGHIQKTLRKFGVKGGLRHALGFSGLLPKKFGFLHHRTTIDGSGPQNFVYFERLVYLGAPFGPARGTAVAPPIPPPAPLDERGAAPRA